MYIIKAAVFIIRIPWCKKFAHDFWVLENLESNKVIAQLHGLATSRRTGDIVPIGYRKDHSLRAHQLVLCDDFAKKYHFTLKKSALPVHASHTVYEGNDAVDRWLFAVNAINTINDLDLDYPRGGIRLPLRSTVNSNSIFHTLADTMHLPAYTDPNYIHIGFGNTLPLNDS